MAGSGEHGCVLFWDIRAGGQVGATSWKPRKVPPDHNYFRLRMQLQAGCVRREPFRKCMASSVCEPDSGFQFKINRRKFRKRVNLYLNPNGFAT